MYDLDRQPRFGALQTVLYIHGRQIGIGRDVECNGRRKTARIGTRRLHVDHTRRTIQLLFDRCRHGLRYGLCIGSGIGGRNRHHGRYDLRILVDGQHRQTDAADDDDNDGENR